MTATGLKHSGPDTGDGARVSSGDLMADRRYGYGRDLASRGDLAAAADLFAQATEAAPGFAAAWFALGEMREKLGDGAGAAAAFREALRLDPGDRHGAALHLARLGAADPEGAMSPSYVRTLFDQYAPRFDGALVEGLAYRGPQRLLDAVERARSPDPQFGAMLDLGCGTGLAGAAFRPLVRHLTGVDLSPGMIAEAHAKGIYDRLETGELVEFLAAERAARRRYDLVIAADVFVYLFDLAPVARAVADVLSPGGLFAFTVETHDGDGSGDGSGDGVELGDKLRYRHGAAHVRAALVSGRLRLIELAPVATRIESGATVPGLLSVATGSSDKSEGLPS
jgi:predicted TPR repeat methyltransferase